MAQRSNRRSGSLVKNVVLDTAIFMRPGARGTHLGQGLERIPVILHNRHERRS